MNQKRKLPKIYTYAKCSTCTNAVKFLDRKEVTYSEIPIVDQPPTLSELSEMLSILKQEGKDLKNLFNTSGVLYREMKISDRLKTGLTEKDALKLLSENGKLIKRPFVLTENGGTVGFKEAEWKNLF